MRGLLMRHPGTYLVEELRKDGQSSASKEPFKMKFVWQAAFDYKVWCASMYSLLVVKKNLDSNLSSVYFRWIVRLYLPSYMVVWLTAYPSDGALYAFSLFTPSIINKVSAW
jgi:hypothetical protein